MIRFQRFVVFSSKTLKTMSNMSLNRSCSYATKPPEISLQTSNETVGDKVNGNEDGKQTTDREINLFGPQDIRAPLNGNIGLASSRLINSTDDLNREIKIKQIKQEIDEKKFYDLMAIDTKFRHFDTVQQFLSPELEAEHEFDMKSLSSSRLELVAHNCPLLLITDFQDLFPLSRRPNLNNGLTVVTLCQKTSNDMSSWTTETDQEREELMEHFVTLAKNICEYLTNLGFWADFIDPSSGRPFLVCFTYLLNFN